MEPHALVSQHTVLAVIAGMHAYGLETEESDTVRRGVYVAPINLFWGLTKPPTTVDGPEFERVSWEVEPFCASALAADPAVLEVLASPLIETNTPLGMELRALLPAMLSQRIADTFRRATARSFAKAAAAMASGGTPRWTDVMHVLRLLITCEQALTTGVLTLDMSQRRHDLLAVQAGDVPWPDIVRWVEDLRTRTAKAVVRSPLSVAPDQETVEQWLISVRARSVLVSPASGSGELRS